MITATIGSWQARYTGGRTADVWHAAKHGYPLDCFQVGEYDWQKGELTESITQPELRARLREWVDEVGGDYERELPYL